MTCLKQHKTIKTVKVIGIVALMGVIALAVGDVMQGQAPQSEAARNADTEDAEYELGYREALKASRVVNLNLDQENAVRIAEIIFVKVFGKRVLDERPWKVTKKGKIFRIAGTVHADLGGAAVIEINQTNAQVMSLTHFK